MNVQEKRACKRLWWCCVIRDRIIALASHSPLLITMDQFDHDTATPLTADDFEDEISASEVYEPNVKRLLVELFLLQSQLAAVLSQTIVTVSQLRGPSTRTSNPFAVAQALISRCKTALDLWFKEAATKFPIPAGLTDVHRHVILHTNLMYIYYQ